MRNALEDLGKHDKATAASVSPIATWTPDYGVTGATGGINMASTLVNRTVLREQARLS